MSRVDDILIQITSLSNAERAELEKRLSYEEWKAWDEQIQADFDSGKLDSILDEVRKDAKLGKTSPMP